MENVIIIKELIFKYNSRINYIISINWYTIDDKSGHNDIDLHYLDDIKMKLPKLIARYFEVAFKWITCQ